MLMKDLENSGFLTPTPLSISLFFKTSCGHWRGIGVVVLRSPSLARVTRTRFGDHLTVVQSQDLLLDQWSHRFEMSLVDLFFPHTVQLLQQMREDEKESMELLTEKGRETREREREGDRDREGQRQRDRERERDQTWTKRRASFMSRM
jgi:hypothetical protein